MLHGTPRLIDFVREFAIPAKTSGNDSPPAHRATMRRAAHQRGLSDIRHAVDGQNLARVPIHPDQISLSVCIDSEAGSQSI